LSFAASATPDIKQIKDEKLGGRKDSERKKGKGVRKKLKHRPSCHLAVGTREKKRGLGRERRKKHGKKKKHRLLVRGASPLTGGR